MGSGREKFEEELLAILEANQPEARSILAGFRRSLQQYGIEHEWKPKDILVEVFIRTERKFDSGEQIYIENTKAWIRKVGFLVVKELSRKRSKEQTIVSQLNRGRSPELRTAYAQENLTTVNEINEKEVSEDLEKVRRALQMLEPKNREILRLRLIEKIPYEEILRNNLVTDGSKVQTVTALRKRYSRAYQQFRRLFHEVEEVSKALS
jgi:DNA-directed RNA polymerase specialized sigma24 family protein